MDFAVVCQTVAPIYEKAGEDSQRLDEVLLGMEVKRIEAGETWCRVATEWGTEGYIESATIILGEDEAGQWRRYGKTVARASFVDVLTAPSAAGAVLVSVPKGGLLHATGAQDEGGYLPVELPGGERGYAKGGNLMPQLTGKAAGEISKMREALATSALSYLGTQFRQGGRTAYGIDDQGVVLMAYLLNGVVLTHGCLTSAEGPLYPIQQSALAMGDVVVFNNHVGLYLGDGNFVHSTDAPGSDGVVINSLLPQSPFYVKELASQIVGCGSLFT